MHYLPQSNFVQVFTFPNIILLRYKQISFGFDWLLGSAIP